MIPPTTTTICTMFNLPCRHCSNERKNDIQREGNLAEQNFKKTVAVIDLGQYCNNHPIEQSGWIREMSSCPVIDDIIRWGMYRSSILPQLTKKVKALRQTTLIATGAKGRSPARPRTVRGVEVSTSKKPKRSLPTTKPKKKEKKIDGRTTRWLKLREGKA